MEINNFSFILARLRALENFFLGRITFVTLVQLLLPSSMRKYDELTLQIVHCNQYHIELIKPDGFVVDAGANEGVFSIYAAQKYPHATIYAFEPAPTNFKKLQENTSHYPNIKCFNYALGDENKSIFFTDGVGWGDHQAAEGIKVEMKTFDSFNLQMDFLKMDVEGAEESVLMGARETIKKYHPVVAMSAYHKKDDVVRLPSVLDSIAPYQCKLYHDREDDLICS